MIPGTTQKIVKNILEKESGKKSGKDFGLVTNPEFLREGLAVDDLLKPHLIVIGENKKNDGIELKKYYKQFYKDCPEILFTDLSSAELIKYSNNAFLATKISFINSVSNLCEKVPGANVDDIAKAIGLDPRIGPYFLKAGPGFGGSCLPKDLTSFIHVYRSFDVAPTLFSSVKNVNNNQLNQIISILENKFNKFSGKTISILGLSFKENSDDIRESRSIKLIKNLLKKKSNVKVFDLLAINNTRKIFGEKIIYCNSIYDCFKNSDCAIIMNPDPYFTKISNKDFQSMKHKLVIDTRRIVEQKNFQGVEFIALGVSQNNQK